MTRAMGRLGGLLSALVALSACGTDLGECDMAAATRIVYRAGIPYFEGQAVVETNCAGSFCHTGTAQGADRLGAPAGLNFDVAVVTPGMGAEAARRHGKGYDTITEWAEQMLAEVQAGTMPPGDAGKRPPETWVHASMNGALPTGVPSELYDVRTPQGEETLRNWLACGHRTVTGTTDLEPDVRAEVDALGGTVLPRNVARECVPTGTVVYEQVVAAGECVGCHNPDSPNFNANPTNRTSEQHALDLSSPVQAYANLFNQQATGGACMSTGLTLVEPFDCKGSLLYQKLAAMPSPGPCSPLDATACGDDGVCGGVMPPPRTGPFDADLLACLCEWIDAGAPMN